MLGFNRVLRCFRDELTRPEVQAKVEQAAELTTRCERLGLEIRQDLARSWENSQVLLQLDSLVAAGAQRVLDFGGGNSPICYLLAESGLQVTVLDIDTTVIERVNHNATTLGLEDRVRAVACRQSGMNLIPWPLGDSSFDVVVSISVFEGLLRSRRPHHFAEIRRVLAPGGSLLMTFDYGPGARFVSDPPTSAKEIDEQIVTASGMELVGDALTIPDFDPAIGPPVKALVPSIDGHDVLLAAYSFGAVHLRNAR